MADLQSFLSPEVTTIAIALLATFSIGGIIYALFEPQLSGRTAREKRMKSVAVRNSAAIDATRKARDGDRRRKSVQDQLKEFEAARRRSSSAPRALTLDERIDQAGLSWSKRGFIVFSVICALVLGLVGLTASGSLIVTRA